RTGKQMSVAAEAVELDAEAMQPGQTQRMQGTQDGLDIGGSLTAAHRTDAHQLFRSEVNAGLAVQGHAADVVQGNPSLDYRDEWQIRPEFPQGAEVGYRPALVFRDAESGLGHNLGLAHPVLGSSPEEPPDFTLVPTNPV